METVEALVIRYFKNRDMYREIKASRIEYLTEHKCEGNDCIRDGTEKAEWCAVCKQRHEFFLSLKKITYENLGIMRKLRTATKALETK